MSAHPNLFTPIKAGPFTLPNRIVMGSMHTGLEGQPHAVPRIAAFYAARTRGGTALIVTGGYGPNRGAKHAAERDAKRAIEDGARIGAAV